MRGETQVRSGIPRRSSRHAVRLLVATVLFLGLWGAPGTAAGAADDLGHDFTNQVAAWGANGSGQLDFGTTAGPQLCTTALLPCSATPIASRNLRDVSEVAAGQDFGLALTSGGRVLAWGSNGFGQLGNDDTASSDSPTAVCGTNAALGCRRPLRRASAISAGEGQALALLENGTVVAWGANGAGQLGDGTTANSDRPMTVCAVGETSSPCRPLEGAVAVAAGGGYSMALLRDGTVVAWGENEAGQLGDGTRTASDVPVAVGGLGGVKAIAAGRLTPTALLENGTVMQWGLTHQGIEVIRSDVPATVEGLTGVKAIAAGDEFRLALLEDGTVDGWGENSYLQLGEREALDCFYGGGVFCRNTPEPVPGLSGVKSIAAGGYGALALLEDGAVIVWGEGANGEAGNGNYGWQSDEHCQTCLAPPAPVCGFSQARGIAAGGLLDLAYGAVGAGTPCPRGPWVMRIAPDEGLPGTPITISGNNFRDVRSLMFDELSITFKVLSPHTITAVVPSVPSSSVRNHVTVVTAAGPSGYIPVFEEPGTNSFWLREPR